MLKVHLKGQRSNRTPLAYPEYRELFRERLEYVDSPSQANLLIYSCFMDIRDEAEELAAILSRNPGIRLVILSEEPYWDLLWSNDLTKKNGQINLSKMDYRYTFLNHKTTGIYDFLNIPYFLTTSDDYFARYAFLFARNAAASSEELLNGWQAAAMQAVFLAEFRSGTESDPLNPHDDIRGLSSFRTRLAQELQGDRIIRAGNGWGSPISRQSLPDWHLDKLAALDRRAMLVSAIENTHQANYISEKLFDAFAVRGIPLYFASPLHWVARLVPSGSFLNLFGLTATEAAQAIGAFTPDACFVDVYKEAQDHLAETFSNPRHLIDERWRVVDEVVSELDLCRSTEA